MTMIKELVDEYKVEGIIDVVLQSCHPFSVERYQVKKLSEDLKIPYMSIETDYSKTDVGQLTTRIQAFIEML